ncbi:MAG: hypothetical protein WBC69_05435, partial [Geitlerinemataceae cyanobacterium]
KFLKLLGRSAMGLAGLLAVWIVGGNYIASQQEKEIERDLAAFARRFPKTEPNDSALKLAALVAKLGLNSGVIYDPVESKSKSLGDFTPSEVDRKAFEDIQEELGDYLGVQIAKPNDTIDPPSEKLRRYLASKQTVLTEIYQHVLTHEALHWGTDISGILEGDLTTPLPDFFWLANFHKILAVDTLEKYRQGQVDAAAEMLEVSWKFNQSLTEQPDLLPQLVALIVNKYSVGVMRKFDNFPTQWQQRLLEHNRRNSLLIALQGEAFYDFKLWQDFLWKENALSEIEEEMKSIYEQLGATPPVFSSLIQMMRSVYWIDASDSPISSQEVIRERIFDWILSKAIFGLKPVMKPYIRFSAIDAYRVKEQSLATSARHNVCVSDSIAVDGFSPWNYIGRTFNSNWMSNPIGRVDKSMLDLELTQKILQVKALAAKEGKWLPSVPDMESSICPGAKWVYGVAPDGTMSIEFSEQPEWLEERLENGGLPFTYSDKTPPKPEKPAATPPQR